MQRIVEPELMDDAAQTLAYAQADFSEANTLFIDLLAKHAGEHLDGHCLDLGCGPGDICFRLAEKFPAIDILGIDGAANMLTLANKALARQTDKPQVKFEHHVLPSVSLKGNYYNVITSNSLLHHLHNPAILWQTIKHCGKPGCQILIMDLFRPDREAAARDLVEQYAAEESAILKKDFFHSLCAAFTIQEVQQQLITAGLEKLLVSTVSDRHLSIAGRL